MPLKVSDQLQLPDSIVTESVAILAKRGTGKSNAGVVIAEEITDIGHQWVAIDPKGDWWGIRSNAEGTGPGLQVPIFGGSHGDVPLEATGGAVMARLIVEQGISCLLDVSEFSKGDQIRFVTDFCEQLFRSVKADPRPLMLILEEAEEFLPQRVDARTARMVGICSKISKQGRQMGLGVLLITQRSASLNKDALSQIDTLILFRTTSPHDRKAVVAWADHQGEAGEIAESLSSLEPGESWIISPGYLGSVQRIRWRRRRTFDSGATPSTAGKRRPAPDLGSIDLDAIAEQLSDTIERAAADDPKVLRRRIAQLEQQLADALAATPDPVEVRIEVPVFPDDMLTEWCEEIDLSTSSLLQISDRLGNQARSIHDHLAAAHQWCAQLAAVTALPSDIGPKSISGNVTPLRPPAAATEGTWGGTLDPPTPAAPQRRTGPANPSLSKSERAILAVLAQHADSGRTKVQVALLAGYSSKSGGFRNALSSLRAAGYIDRGEPMHITSAGLDAIGDAYDPLPTGRALVDHWLNQLGRAERLILEHLVDIWPAIATKDEIATATGYSPTSGGFRNALSRLRTLQLIDGRLDITAADELGATNGRTS